MSQQGRILITGGAGFIGSHLTEALLTDDWDVTVIDNFTDFYPPENKRFNLSDALVRGAKLIDADITDDHAMGEAFNRVSPDVVVHLAALAGVRPSIERPALYTHVNVTGTQIVLDHAVRTGTERIVVASSSSVYGNNEKTPFSETDDVSRPISPYASTKVATELICQTMSHLHSVPISALRFFTVFGPRQRPDLAIQKFMTRMANGQPIPLFGDGSMSRDFTFIGDIVDGVRRAIEHCGDVEPFRIYNLGSDRPISVRELIEAIEEVTGIRAKIDHQPQQPGDVQRTWADLTRAHNELGYAASTSLRDGLERQWAWNQQRLSVSA